MRQDQATATQDFRRKSEEFKGLTKKLSEYFELDPYSVLYRDWRSAIQLSDEILSSLLANHPDKLEAVQKLKRLSPSGDVLAKIQESRKILSLKPSKSQLTNPLSISALWGDIDRITQVFSNPRLFWFLFGEFDGLSTEFKHSQAALKEEFEALEKETINHIADTLLKKPDAINSALLADWMEKVTLNGIRREYFCYFLNKLNSHINEDKKYQKLMQRFGQSLRQLKDQKSKNFSNIVTTGASFINANDYPLNKLESQVLRNFFIDNKKVIPMDMRIEIIDGFNNACRPGAESWRLEQCCVQAHVPLTADQKESLNSLVSIVNPSTTDVQVGSALPADVQETGETRPVLLDSSPPVAQSNSESNLHQINQLESQSLKQFIISNKIVFSETLNPENVKELNNLFSNEFSQTRFLGLFRKLGVVFSLDQYLSLMRDVFPPIYEGHVTEKDADIVSPNSIEPMLTTLTSRDQSVEPKSNMIMNSQTEFGTDLSSNPTSSTGPQELSVWLKDASAFEKYKTAIDIARWVMQFHSEEKILRYISQKNFVVNDGLVTFKQTKSFDIKQKTYIEFDEKESLDGVEEYIDPSAIVFSKYTKASDIYSLAVIFCKLFGFYNYGFIEPTISLNELRLSSGSPLTMALLWKQKKYPLGKEDTTINLPKLDTDKADHCLASGLYSTAGPRPSLEQMLEAIKTLALQSSDLDESQKRQFEQYYQLVAPSDASFQASVTVTVNAQPRFDVFTPRVNNELSSIEGSKMTQETSVDSGKPMQEGAGISSNPPVAIAKPTNLATQEAVVVSTPVQAQLDEIEKKRTLVDEERDGQLGSPTPLGDNANPKGSPNNASFSELAILPTDPPVISPTIPEPADPDIPAVETSNQPGALPVLPISREPEFSDAETDEERDQYLDEIRKKIDLIENEKLKAYLNRKINKIKTEDFYPSKFNEIILHDFNEDLLNNMLTKILSEGISKDDIKVIYEESLRMHRQLQNINELKTFLVNISPSRSKVESNKHNFDDIIKNLLPIYEGSLEIDNSDITNLKSAMIQFNTVLLGFSIIITDDQLYQLHAFESLKPKPKVSMNPTDSSNTQRPPVTVSSKVVPRPADNEPQSKSWFFCLPSSSSNKTDKSLQPSSKESINQPTKKLTIDKDNNKLAKSRVPHSSTNDIVPKFFPVDTNTFVDPSKTSESSKEIACDTKPGSTDGREDLVDILIKKTLRDYYKLYQPEGLDDQTAFDIACIESVYSFKENKSASQICETGFDAPRLQMDADVPSSSKPSTVESQYSGKIKKFPKQDNEVKLEFSGFADNQKKSDAKSADNSMRNFDLLAALTYMQNAVKNPGIDFKKEVLEFELDSNSLAFLKENKGYLDEFSELKQALESGKTKINDFDLPSKLEISQKSNSRFFSRLFTRGAPNLVSDKPASNTPQNPKV